MLDIQHPIRTLAEGEKITKPGFYDIPLERHHSQPCDGPSVTSSVLRKMELRTPADVWAFHDLNPDRWERPPLTSALREGAAMALYLEGGIGAVRTHFQILPADKPRRPTPLQIAAYEEGRASDAAIASVEFWEEVEAAPTDWLEQSQLDQIIAMGNVLKKDPGALVAMSGIPEVTMAWQDEATGLWLLARPDTVSFDGTMSDYKKIASRGAAFNAHLVDRRITEHGYDMQMAFGVHVFERLTSNRPEQVSITAQCGEEPHHVILREIADEDLRIAEFRNRRAIRRFAECLESGHWPGPGEDVGCYMRPKWQHEQLIEEMNTAGVAQ